MSALRAFLSRLRDIYTHPGEYPTQRQYRRYLAGIDQAQKVERAPYILSNARLVAGPDSWIARGKERDARMRLEYLRGEIEAEQISQGEIAELTDFARYIEPDDTDLLQWAGVPEFADGDDVDLDALDEGQVLAYNMERIEDDPKAAQERGF